MPELSCRRFLPQDEYVKSFKDRGKAVPPFIVGQPYVVRGGVEGYMVPCARDHPAAEKDIYTEIYAIVPQLASFGLRTREDVLKSGVEGLVTRGIERSNAERIIKTLGEMRDTYRFVSEDMYAEVFKDQIESPPFPVILFNRGGVKGYFIPCASDHPDAEEDIIATKLVEQAEEDYRGWGDSFIAGLGEMHSPYLALREFVGRVERIEPDPHDFDSAAPYRQSSYANACRYLGIETKYNRGKASQVSE